jgi:hypothetical protein
MFPDFYNNSGNRKSYGFSHSLSDSKSDIFSHGKSDKLAKGNCFPDIFSHHAPLIRCS